MEEKKKERNKGGRPKKSNKRERKFGFYATLSEGAIIDAKAKRSGLRPADYIRDIAVNGKVRTLPTPEEIQWYKDLSGVCNNLNQLTKEAHKQNLAFVVPKLLNSIDEIHKHMKTYDSKSLDR